MNNSNEYVDNLFIKFAAADLISNFSEETRSRLLLQFIVRMKDDGTAPAPMMNSVHVALNFSPDIELEDVFPDDFEPEKRNCLMGYEDKTYMPLFTDVDELDDFADSNIVEPMPIKDIIEKALEDEDIAGIVINPFNEALCLTRDTLEFILCLFDEADSEAC